MADTLNSPLWDGLPSEIKVKPLLRSSISQGLPREIHKVMRSYFTGQVGEREGSAMDGAAVRGVLVELPE